MVRSLTVLCSVPPALLALSLVIAIHPSPSGAADGFPVCDVAGDQDSPSLALATDLATWVAWRDQRRGDNVTDVYVARLVPVIAVPGKTPAFETFAATADGIAVCQSGTAGPPVAVPTDSGGVLVLWGDNRVPRGIYGSRILPNGSRYPGWPVDGRLISSDVEDITLVACTDGAGGAYFGRKPAPIVPGTQRIVVTRMTKEGAIAPGWTAAGVAIGGDELVQGVTLAPDPLGGAAYSIRLYFDGVAANPQYGRAGRVTPTAGLAFDVSLPGWRSGGVEPGVVGSLAIADGGGGIFAAWNDAPGPEFYGQHWNAAAATQWPDSLPAPHLDALVADGAGGVYLAGREKQDLNRLSVLRRNSSGAVSAEWDAAGRLLADPLALAHVGAIPKDGGVFVFWSEFRGAGGGFDIRASQVDSEGRLGPGWVGGGDAVCDVPGHQTNVVGTAGSAVLAWVDERNQATTKKDLWAKYILGPTGTVDVSPLPGAGPPGPPGPRIRAVFPNPARSDLRVALTLRPGAPARFELVDLRGRIVRQRVVAEGAGEGIVTLDIRGLPSGLYAVRVVQEGHVDHARVTVLN